MDNNAFIKQQLTFGSGCSRAEERSLIVLDYLAQGIIEPTAISYGMKCTTAQVVAGIRELGKRGYVTLGMNSEFMRITKSGWALAKKRAGIDAK